VIGISDSAKPFNLLGGHEPAPYALYSLEFTASHHAVTRRSPQTAMNLKRCEQIANARKGDDLRLHEKQDDSNSSAKPTCGAN
jgi:hypothetical protein